MARAMSAVLGRSWPLSMFDNLVNWYHVFRLRKGKRMWNVIGLGRSRKGPTSVLGRQIAATLCPGMSLPGPLDQLFGWIEARGYFVDTPNGRLGFLFSETEMKESWTDSGRLGGTDVGFA